MTVKQLKMWSRETVRRNRNEPAETENLSNSQKCLITLHIVGWVIMSSVNNLGKLFDALMVFLKEFFQKVNFEKNQQTTKKHEKLPSMQ